MPYTTDGAGLKTPTFIWNSFQYGELFNEVYNGIWSLVIRCGLFPALDLWLQLTNITKEISKIAKEAQAMSGLGKTRFTCGRIKKKIWATENILIQNQPDALISQIYFWNKTLHVSDSFSVHHQEFFTVNTAIVYVVTACEQDQEGTAVPSWSCCSQAVSTYTIAVCTVKNSWWWTEKLSETYRVLFQK